LFFAIQKEEIKIHDVDEAIELLKQNYSVSNNYSVVNITNGWRFEFLKIDGNCSLECVETHIYFDVYKNGTIIKNAQLKNVTRIENENDALNYVLYKFPEFKKIKKCEFEEKLMCHEDIIINKINNSWNITFMNESKGCNNECVIEHYYSFIVEKNGEIVKDTEKERMVTLDDVFEKGTEYPRHIIGEGLGRADTAEWLPFNGVINTIERNNYIYLSFYIPATNKNYVTKYGIKTYNIILEKFSTKTINNESDVLEAFERYLKLFDGRSIMEIKKLRRGVITSKDMEKYADRYIEGIRYGGNGFEDRLKPKIIKKGSYWLANISVFNYPSCNVSITDYEVVLSDRGAVINLTVTNTTSRLFCLPPL